MNTLKRPRFQSFWKLLQSFDAELLQKADCYFAGGTAIALRLDEYRESVDIDFLCASAEGYRLLRNIVGQDLGPLMHEQFPVLRDVRTTQNKIVTTLLVDDQKIKVELVREDRIPLESEASHLPVPVLARHDLYAEKLLANADRCLDRNEKSRDIIDLALMIQGWGDIPQTAWEKAYKAYGEVLKRSFHQAVGMVSDRRYLMACMQSMRMDTSKADEIIATLHVAAGHINSFDA